MIRVWLKAKKNAFKVISFTDIVKYQQFQKMVKPIMILTTILVFAGAAIIIFSMLTEVYKDTAIYGTIKTVNGSSVTLTDGRMFNAPTVEIERYCLPGNEIRLETGNRQTVWCNSNPISVNALQDLE